MCGALWAVPFGLRQFPQGIYGPRDAVFQCDKGNVAF